MIATVYSAYGVDVDKKPLLLFFRLIDSSSLTSMNGN